MESLFTQIVWGKIILTLLVLCWISKNILLRKNTSNACVRVSCGIGEHENRSDYYAGAKCCNIGAGSQGQVIMMAVGEITSQI